MNNSQVRSYLTKLGSEIKITSITFEDGRSLIRNYKGTNMEWLSNPDCSVNYYLLKDQRVVKLHGLDPEYSEEVNFPGPGATVYEPYEAFIEYINETLIRKHIVTEFPAKKYFRLPGGERVEYTRINHEDWKQLREKAIKFDHLYYGLPNGEILTDHPVDAVFKSRADFEKYQAYYRKNSKYNEQKRLGTYNGILTWNLNGINKFGKDTLDHIDEMAESLPTVLDAPENIFDYSVDNLFKIDKHLYKHTFSYEFQECLFLPLLTYIGQTYLKINGGSWELLYDELNDLWLPDIRQPDGEMKMLYHPVSIILDPEEGQGSYIPLKVVYLHTAPAGSTGPKSSD